MCECIVFCPVRESDIFQTPPLRPKSRWPRDPDNANEEYAERGADREGINDLGASVIIEARLVMNRS